MEQIRDCLLLSVGTADGNAPPVAMVIVENLDRSADRTEREVKTMCQQRGKSKRCTNREGSQNDVPTEREVKTMCQQRGKSKRCTNREGSQSDVPTTHTECKQYSTMQHNTIQPHLINPQKRSIRLYAFDKYLLKQVHKKELTTHTSSPR